jgi:microcystin-dependent protein
MQMIESVVAHVETEDLYVGAIREFGTNESPSGWLECDGASYTQVAYPALHAVMALDAFPWGGDANNFNVPDCKGRCIMGSGTGSGLTPRSLGQHAGAHEVTLTTNQIPAHTHTFRRRATTHNIMTCVSGVFDMWNLTMATYSSGNSGGGLAHNNVGPVGVTKMMIYTGA